MANISKIKTPDGTTYDIQAKELSLNIIDSIIGHDNTPFLYRAVPSAAAGAAAELDEIVGGSVVWNQLVQNGNFADDSLWTKQNITLSVSDNVATVTYTGGGTYTGYLRNSCGGVTSIIGHKYFSLYEAKLVSGSVNTRARVGASDGRTVALTSSWQTISSVVSATGEYAEWNVTVVTTSEQNSVFEVRNCICIDLTALFGSTIADYIYSLEQSTAGSGIAWLKSYGYLTKDYYGYTANKIESVSVARHVMKDSNDSVIGSYAINPITLRGIPKLNASNQLYYDGDRYEASGRVTRKYGVVDLGSLAWGYTNGRFITDNYITDIKSTSSNFVAANILTDRYLTSTANNTESAENDKIVAINRYSNICIKDSAYTDATTFKTAMNRVYLIYEKATPTYEDSSPFEANQIVDANGTEEYIDAGVEAGTRDVAIPVGHETDYVASMTRGIGLPVQPNTDGVYNLQMNVTNSNAIFEFETASQALTYTLGTSGNNLTLTPSSGSAQSITAPYATNAGKVNNHTVNKDVPSDAVFTDNNTTYTFAEGTTNGAFKVTPSGGTAQSVPVHGVLTSHQSVTDNNPTLSWGTKSKVATIGSTDINVTMPSNPASGKQDTITGGATTITSSNLTASRALISNASGKVAVSDVTSTELGYLAGLDRNVMGFYTAKTYNYNISNDDMRGISGQYERNGVYWINVENWLGTMPPSGNYGYFEVMGNLQRFTPYSSEGSSTVYTRTYANSAWSDWTVINNPKYNTDLYRKITTVTVGKSSDNGVTSTKTPGYAIVDFNEKVYAKFTGYANTNGVTAARIGAVNTKTDGTDVTNYLYVGVRKNGDCYYSVTDDAQFRSDLGIQATITGAASTITSNNLDTSRALISNSNGKVSVSSTTSTELARLSGVTSNVQTQLDNRLTLSGGTITGNLNRQMSSSITIGKTSNNGVSSDTYGGFYVTDSNDYYFTRVRGTGYTDGRVAAVLESRNMKTNGDAITNIFVVGVKKNGDYYYKVTSPTAFREAIRTVTDISSTLVKDEASVANSSSTSNKELGSFTVAPGTWLITYTVRFADNSTGDRFTMITETNSTSADSVGFKFTCDMQANTNKPTYCRATGIYYNTTGANKTLYIRGYQNSGSTLTYSTYVDLVCLRPTITD